MRIIGFNLTKIFAERTSDKITKKPSTSIEFIDLKEDKTDFLKEDKVLKIFFKYSINYGEQENEKEGELIFQGNMILSVSKDESKEITKAWKNKSLPASINVTLFNFILRRCTPKAIFIEDEISLPIHTPMPKIESKKEDE